MNLRSGYPFWLIKNGLPYDYAKLEESLRTEVVVLGGGISGALVAYHLINAGVDVVLVDARSIGLGSTCASTALLQYEIDTALHELIQKVGEQHAVRSYELCSESIDKISAIAKKLHYKDFTKKKSLFFSAYKKDIPFLKKEFASRKEHGFQVNYLEEDEVKKDYGFTADAILSQQGAQIDAYSFTHALHQHSMHNGLRIFDRTPIAKIQHHANGVELKSENGFSIKAKKIVYATGYEVVEFIDKKIVDLQSTYATISEQSNTANEFWKDDVLMWNTASPYLYMRTTSDRRMLIGGRDEEFFNPVKRDKLINSKTAQLVNDFHHVFPGKPFKPEFSWTGTFGVTKDGLPFIGNYKKLPNSSFALGFGGNGITFSLIAAEILADLITGKKNSDADIFRFERV